MVKYEKVTILKKKDLSLSARNLPIEEINTTHIISMDLLRKSDVVMYIDNGRNKILKDRYYNGLRG